MEGCFWDRPVLNMNARRTELQGGRVGCDVSGHTFAYEHKLQWELLDCLTKGLQHNSGIKEQANAHN